MDLLLTSAAIPGTALLAWIYTLLRKPSGSAKLRYVLSVGLIAYGIAAVVITGITIFVGLETGFITWGGPDNFWIAAVILSALFSIGVSGVMAVANIAVLRFTRSEFSQGTDE